MNRRRFLQGLGVAVGAVAMPGLLKGHGVVGNTSASKAEVAGSSPAGLASSSFVRNPIRCAVTDAPDRPMALPGDSVRLVRHLRSDIPLVISAKADDEIFGVVLRLERRPGQRWAAWVWRPEPPRSTLKFTTYETGDVVLNGCDGYTYICMGASE